MKLTEVKYHGAGLSQRERENIVHKISKAIPVNNIYYDDWRVSIETDLVVDTNIIRILTQMFGEPTRVDGYMSGVFRKKINPRWIVKDHQITVSYGYGDIDIEISKHET